MPLSEAAVFRMLALGTLAGAFIWSWVEVRFAIRFAHRFGLLAPVTDRSAHRVPTPTVGGMAIVDAVLAAGLVLNLLPRGDSSMIYGVGINAAAANWLLLGCGAAMGIMGFIDDWRSVPPWPKLMVQLACALPPAWLMRHGAWFGEDTWGWLWGQTDYPAGFSIVNDTWMWMTFALNVAWMMLVINIFNFMDGMDGLAGLFAGAVAMAIGAMTALRIAGFDALLGVGEVLFIALATVGATLGFLSRNLPPAHTFMGDVGSQFLGWLLATLALMAHVPLADADVSVSLVPVTWAPLLLFLPFLGDGLFTMARRARRGENILTPHFTHLYQRLLTCGQTHAQVLLAEAGVIFGCAALTLALLLVRPALQPLLGLAGLGLMLALWLHVRAAETRPDS